MNTYKRNSMLFNSLIIVLLVAVFAVVLIGKKQDMSQPCKIISINSRSITAQEWDKHYWKGGLTTVEISATNSEAEIGDFVNLSGQLVDCDGNVLTTIPEQIGNVYAVTDIDKVKGLWTVVQGPLTYQASQGVTLIPIANRNVKVGDLVNDEGQKVDMFGRPA